MIKPILFTAALLLATAMTGEAMAAVACSGTQITDGSSPTLSALLSGNTMCQGSGATITAQEGHIAGGSLNDYKKGPTDPVDPTAVIGSWAVSGAGPSTIVTYTYGTNVFSYNVFLKGGAAGQNGSTYSFCSSGVSKATATLYSGIGTTSRICP